MVPGLGSAHAWLPAGIAGLLLATNNVFPDGIAIIAEGTAPLGTPVPTAVSSPVPRSMVKEEMVEFPWVATKRAPVPEPTVELDDEQPFKPSSKNADTIDTNNTSPPGRKRNLVPILCPCPLSSS